MPRHAHVINPALEQNIDLIVKLMQSQHGDKAGVLEAYQKYSLVTEGEEEFYSLTYTVLQFVANEESVPEKTTKRLDVIEPYTYAEGHYGDIHTVVQSIIFKDEVPCFDQQGHYLVKAIIVDRDLVSDKPNKPNGYLRSAAREHYLASQFSHLGANYQLVHHQDFAYLHMNHVPGKTLDSYIDRLDAREFLKLAIALLEQIPTQLHTRVRSGKHQGDIIIHCDLKPSNIMAHQTKQGDWVTQIVDLGLAKARKDGEVIIDHIHGNKMVLDGVLLKSVMNDETFHYNKQSDLYALYVCILHLGGALTRSSFTNGQLSLLLKDLKTPNLSGLFDRMDFTAHQKMVLTELIRGMLDNDRSHRISREEALKGFREVLLSYKPQVVKETTQQTPSPRPVVTAIDLKNCVEEHLEGLAKDNKQNNRCDTFQTVQSWIQRFRNLGRLVTQAEHARFEQMLSNREVKIVSNYIYNVLRFGLIADYDDVAATRLLLRHHHITKPLLKKYPLSYDWLIRFQMFLEEIALQTAHSNEALCRNIALMKENVSAVLAIPLTETSPQLFTVLHQTLQQQLAMNFKEWCNDLPALTDRFNILYYCAAQIALLRQRIQPALGLINEFDDKFEEWAEAVATVTISDRYPSQSMRAYFDLFYDVVDELLLFHKHRPLIKDIIKKYQLEQDPLFDLEKVEEQIQDLDLKNNTQVIELKFALIPLSTMVDLYNRLFHAKPIYFKAAELAQRQFQELLKGNLTSPVLVKQLNDLSDYLDIISYLEDLILDLSLYPNVTNALHLLMTNQAVAMRLYRMAKDQKDNLTNLHKLDSRLETIILKESTDKILEKLFSEFTKYFADPERYKVAHFNTLNPYNFHNKTTRKIRQEQPQVPLIIENEDEDTFCLEL